MTATAADPPVTAGSTALFTDRYELTMLQAAIADGTVDRHCVFEVFARRLPAGRKHWYASVIRHTGRRSGRPTPPSWWLSRWRMAS